jgi:hypothetical protein
MNRYVGARSACRALALLPWQAQRCVTGGPFSKGLPLDDKDTSWQLPKGHKMVNAHNLGGSFMTACGRTFDPAVYTEIIQAMTDQSWGQAIGRQLREDKEYIEMLRTDGGAAQKVDQIFKAGFGNDSEFMQKLKVMLQADKSAALGICAIQDAYTAIRTKRDEHATEVAATARDPFQAVKNQRKFGEASPVSSMPGGM